MRNPRLTVDGAIIDSGRIVLIRRDREPFQGMWALPGGFVAYGETVEEAVAREVFEETGLTTCIRSLLGVYSEMDRDPRGHTVSVAFLLAVTGGILRGGDDAADARWFKLGDLPQLAFDHNQIVKDAHSLLYTP